MIINMFVAATAGTLIPLALRALKVDPALASSVFITTLTDVFGFLSFLGLGTLVLQQWGSVAARGRGSSSIQRQPGQSTRVETPNREPRAPTVRIECSVPVYQSEALILRTCKLGEADKIVVFFTRDRGKKRGVAKGARRPRSRYTGALEPMTRGEVAYTRTGAARSRSPQLRRADAVAAVGGVGGGPGLVGYFAELIDEWAPEAHADERLYRLGSSVIDAIATGAPVDALARYFEYWLLRLQGVYPSIRQCPGCGEGLSEGASMPPREDVFLCRTCAPERSGTRLGAEAMLFLKNATSVAPDRLSTLSLAPRAARELETAHRRLIHVHLDKDLKSARVLREMRQPR